MGDTEQDAQLTRWRRDGCLTIYATTPTMQHGLMIPAPRGYVMELLGGFVGMSPVRQRREAAAVARDVRKALRHPVSAPTQGLLRGVVCLYVADLILGPHIRATAGLITLSLTVELDETLPWQERGLLDPDFMAAIRMEPVLTVKERGDAV